MSEVKHTPGSWEVRSAYKKPLSIWDGDNNLIVTVVHGGDLNERQANAKLIAAAPELLEACINVNKWLMRDFDDGDASNDGLNPEFRKALETVRAAIKSATE